MAKISFYPEKRKNELSVLKVRQVPLLMFFSFEGKRLQYYTGERIDLKDWDFENQHVLASHPEYQSINRHLDFLSRRIMEAYRELKISGQELNVLIIRKKLKEILSKGNASFFDNLILFIEEKNQDWTLATYRKVKTFYNHMRKFTASYAIVPEFEGMDDKFLSLLTSYFRNDLKHIDSTIRKNLEILMWFMNWARSKELHQNYDFRKHLEKYVSISNTKIEEFYLTSGELNSILEFQTSGKKELLARDVFLLACYTGMSCDEIRKLRSKDIDDEWINLSSSRKPRSIPLVPSARLILARYNQKEKVTIFPRIYPAKINRYLKEIARKCGISREVSIIKYSNGSPQDASVLAFMLLTFSVARKTFIHIALESGISPLIVARAAGYKTTASIDLHLQNDNSVRLREFKKFKV